MLRAFQSKARLPSVLPALSTAVAVRPRAIAASLETPVPSRRAQSRPQGASIFRTGDNTGDAPREEVPSGLAPETISSPTNCCGGHYRYFLGFPCSILASCNTMRESNGLRKGETDKARFGRFIIRDRNLRGNSIILSAVA